jgi:hypothetical protein
MINPKTLCAALVLGGLAAAAANAGPILIVSGLSTTSEVGTTNAVVNNLKALHLGAGNTVTVADALPVSLAGYSQVWDVRFDFGLSAAASSEYSGFLGAGGGLFLMGENSNFMVRNNSILSLISSLGGGSVGFNSCFDGMEKVYAPFTGPNAVTNVSYAASGCFNNYGTGSWITSRNDGSMGAGIAFGVGSLSGASKGALTSILDVNFMMNQFDLPNSQNFTKNLIGFVGDQVEPPKGLPEPATLSLLGLAALAAGATRRRKTAG